MATPTGGGEDSGTPAAAAAAAQQQQQRQLSMLYSPSDSVEEAGALLGAAITRCGASSSAVPPPSSSSRHGSGHLSLGGSGSSHGSTTGTPGGDAVGMGSRNSSTHSSTTGGGSSHGAGSSHGSALSTSQHSALQAAAAAAAAASSNSGASSSSSSGGHHPPVASTELFVRLVELRNWLRSHDLPDDSDDGEEPPPHPAAPSLLAVLVKLLSASDPSSSPARSTPMLSNAVRKTWAECVVRCHRLGMGLKKTYGSGGGGGGVDVYDFLRSMMDLAGVNPRSARAAGGTRLAALEVIRGFFADALICSIVAPWALEVLQCCHRGLRSSGSGEPHHRALSVATATCVAVGCRRARLHMIRSSAASTDTDPDEDASGRRRVTAFVVLGAVEEKAVHEAVRLLRRAAEDAFPEVRGNAARFASALAPVLVNRRQAPPPPPVHHATSAGSSSSSQPGGAGGGASAAGTSAADAVSPLSHLDDVMRVAIKNLDDEKAGVANLWAEALARCVCSSIDSAEQLGITLATAKGAAKRDVDDDQEEGDAPGAATAASSSSSSTSVMSKFKNFQESRKSHGAAVSCSSLPNAMEYLVHAFHKTGGELASSGCGGSYSVGGRAPRVGYALSLVYLVQLQTSCGAIGGKTGQPLTDTIQSIMAMVGPGLQQQLQLQRSTSMDATSSSTTPPRGTRASRHQSPADAGLARLAAGRVLRSGLGEHASEQAQQAIVRDLADLCQLASLKGSSKDPTQAAAQSTPPDSDGIPNENQLQVALVEISNLVTALGEAAAATFEYVIPALDGCISHPDHGVRYEAATVYAAICLTVPKECNKSLNDAIGKAKMHKHELFKLASEVNPTSAPEQEAPKRRFRRKRGSASSGANSSARYLYHQYSLHGNALVVSMLLHQVSDTPCDLPTVVLGDIFDLAESLVLCQFDENLSKVNPGASCTCVRAGYCMISAALTIGPKAMSPYIVRLFQMWQRSGASIESSTKHFSPPHDLICLEALIASVVSFLRFCSELLLAVPEALNRTTLLLESLLPLVTSNGRLGLKPANPAATVRLNSVKASIMEAFSWLPPGSYPLAADQLFSLAAIQIREGTEAEVKCSILPSLVNQEDKVLDAQSFYHATAVDQVHGGKDVEDSLVALRSEPANANEREAVLHSLPWKSKYSDMNDDFVLGSALLGYSESEDYRAVAPTPLHEIGTWRKPPPPSPASKVRLIDSAIHSFAATFGLQDGREQEWAMLMIQSLLPPSQHESNQKFSVSLMSESDRKTKTKQENDVASNVVATIVACLKALPGHLGSHDSIGMGPPWMRLAKDLLLTLLSSPCSLVRRASAEGLALLATCGISEDAVSLPSSIFASLLDVIDAAPPDSKQRKASVELAVFAKSSALLTVGCLQRACYRLANGKEKVSRSSRISATLPRPTSRMVMSVLGYLSNQNLDTSPFMVRINALHSFGLLISYFDTAEDSSQDEGVSPENISLAIDILEETFISVWTAVSAELDKGCEVVKFAAEPSLLSVMIRFMTLLLLHLDLVEDKDPTLLSRFGTMAVSLIELSDRHPFVVIEGLAFFERFAVFRQGSPLKSRLSLPDDATSSFVRFSLEILDMSSPSLVSETGTCANFTCQYSRTCEMGAVTCLQMVMQELRSGLISLTSKVARQVESSSLPGRLFAFMEIFCASRCFPHAALFRPVAASRIAEEHSMPFVLIRNEVLSAVKSFFLFEGMTESDVAEGRLLNWLLFARYVISGTIDTAVNNITEDGPFTLTSVMTHARHKANNDALYILPQGGATRWQVKLDLTNMALLSLAKLSMHQKGGVLRGPEGDTWQASAQFNPARARALCAKKCREAPTSDTAHERIPPTSYASLHLEELVSAACTAATATSDQAELPSLQNGGVQFLSSLVRHFGDAVDPDSHPSSNAEDSLILAQFSSQIVSSVRHALDDSLSAGSTPNLFLSGCDALVLLAKKRLINDPVVLRRLVRPVVPNNLNLKPGSYPQCIEDIDALGLRPKSSTNREGVRARLFDRVARLGTYAKIKALRDVGILDSNAMSMVLKELVGAEEGLAVHSIALAIDSFRLAEANDDKGSIDEDGSACVDSKSAPSRRVAVSKGLTFANVEDVNTLTVYALNKMWPMLAAYGAAILSRAAGEFLNGKSDEDGTKVPSAEWLAKVSSLLLTGLRASLGLRKSSDACSNGCSMKRTPDETATLCVFGIRSVMRWPGKFTAVAMARELDIILERLSSDILVASFGVVQPTHQSRTPGVDDGISQTSCQSSSRVVIPSKELILECCKLMESACSDECSTEFSFPALLRSAMLPLVAVQCQSVVLRDDTDIASIVVRSCLISAKHLVTNGEGSIVARANRALIDVSVTLLSRIKENEESLQQMMATASDILRHCMAASSVEAWERRAICQSMAKTGNWVAWRVACSSLGDASGLRFSLETIKQALANFDDPKLQLDAFEAIRNLAQGKDTTKDTGAIIIHGLGAEILLILKTYGLFSAGNTDARVRTTMCADSIRLLLLAFQQLLEDGKQEEIAAFFKIIFQVLIPIVAYNGLPNRTMNNRGSDPAIGRLCAQTIVHFARSDAVAFKLSMSTMTAEECSLLQESMRGEMGGYSTAGGSGSGQTSVRAAGSKKGKINFGAFKT